MAHGASQTPTPHMEIQHTRAHTAFKILTTQLTPRICLVPGAAGSKMTESGVQRFQFAISSDQYVRNEFNSSLLTNWFDAGIARQYAVSGLNLTFHQTVYTCVRAINAAGVVSQPSCSNGITVDLTPPVPLFVYDGLEGDYDVNNQLFTNVIFGSWQFEDPDSGVLLYEWSIGTAPGLHDIMAWEQVWNTTLNGKFELHLNITSSYYVNVRAMNNVSVCALP